MNVDEMRGIRVVRGSFGKAVGAARVIGRGEDCFRPKGGRGGHNARIVGGDENTGELPAFHATPPSALYQRLSRNEMERLARETGGAIAGRNDGSDSGHGQGEVVRS